MRPPYVLNKLIAEHHVTLFVDFGHQAIDPIGDLDQPMGVRRDGLARQLSTKEESPQQLICSLLFLIDVLESCNDFVCVLRKSVRSITFE